MGDSSTDVEAVVAAIINVESAAPQDAVDLAIVLFTFDPYNFGVKEVIDLYAGKSDATCPLDSDRINKMLEEPEVLIAHSAESARSFVCRLFPAAQGKRWKCSYRDINWEQFDTQSRKLRWLLEHFHIETDSVQSSKNGALGLLKLLALKSSEGRSYLSYLLQE